MNVTIVSMKTFVRRHYHICKQCADNGVVIARAEEYDCTPASSVVSQSTSE